MTIGIDVQISAKVLIFHDKTIWRKQLCNFHDYGCRGKTALQTNGTILPQGCRVVTLWQKKK
jgi:hypothetical protein